jgi:hypothetical protein
VPEEPAWQKGRPPRREIHKLCFGQRKRAKAFSTVNRMVAGSSPARGAKHFNHLAADLSERWWRNGLFVWPAYGHFTGRRARRAGRRARYACMTRRRQSPYALEPPCPSAAGAHEGEALRCRGGADRPVQRRPHQGGRHHNDDTDDKPSSPCRQTPKAPCGNRQNRKAAPNPLLHSCLISSESAPALRGLRRDPMKHLLTPKRFLIRIQCARLQQVSLNRHFLPSLALGRRHASFIERPR